MAQRPLIASAALVGALLALASSPALADRTNDEIARAHFATGVGYYDSGRYQQAVREFLEAYRLSARPNLLYNIARAYDKLGDPGRATVFYGRYLTAFPDAPEAADIQAELRRLRPLVATLTVRTSLEGADVLVDGTVVGETPLDPLLVTAGRRRVEVRHPGYAAAIATLDLRGGEPTEVTLEPTPAPPPPAEPAVSSPPTPPPEPTVSPPFTPSPLKPEPLPPPQPPRRRRWLVPVVAAGGGAVVVGTIVGVLVGLYAGPDYAAQARTGCTGTCVLFEGGAR